MMLFRFFIFTLLLKVSYTCSAEKLTSKTPSQSLASIAEAAEQIASDYRKLSWFSGNVLLAKDGEVFYAKAFGMENIKTNRKNTVNTRFNLGSIMKDFTKVLILQHIESGALRMEDTLDKFDLGFPKEIAANITVRHLLNHTSGFADIFTARYRENPLDFDSLEKKLQLLIEQPLISEPGTEFNYSNYGYIVLGAVLEKVSKQSFEQLLEKQVFEPAHMQNTRFKPVANSQHQSVRYAFLYDGSIQEVGITEHPGPDGGIESTVEDVQKFYRALFYGDTLLKRTNTIVIDAFAMAGKHWGSYGGGTGVSAAVEVNLEQGIEIVVLANTDKLVAELISGRIQAFITTGVFADIRLPEVNYAYRFYRHHGKQHFYETFKEQYANDGYTQFIGRTINELGMQLLERKAWVAAFDLFNYLVLLFPEAPQAYDSLAFAYLKKGEIAEAKQTFSKALALNANFTSDYSSENYQ